MHCLGELVCRRHLQGWHWGLAGWGAAKVVWLKGVNPTGSIIVTKLKKICPWLVFLCTAVPVWYRAPVPLARRRSDFSSMLWHGGQMGLFQCDKRAGGATRTLFSLSTVLWEDFNISYLGSDAWSAFLPAPTLLWRLPTAMESVTGRKCLWRGGV